MSKVLGFGDLFLELNVLLFGLPLFLCGVSNTG